MACKRLDAVNGTGGTCFMTLWNSAYRENPKTYSKLGWNRYKLLFLPRHVSRRSQHFLFFFEHTLFPAPTAASAADLPASGAAHGWHKCEQTAQRVRFS